MAGRCEQLRQRLPVDAPVRCELPGDAIKGRDFVINELRKGGFTVRLSNKGVPTSLKFGSFQTKDKIGLPITEQAKLLLPSDAPEPYRLASGAAHSRPWFFTKNAIKDISGKWTARMDLTATTVIVATKAITEAMRVQGGFYGIDTSNAQAQIDQALKNFLQLMAHENGGN